MASTFQDTAHHYAPIWVILFSTGATLLKSAGEHYAIDREIKITMKDVGIALGAATLGYVLFRKRKGTHSDNWYTY